MPLIKYRSWKPSTNSIDLVAKANEIIADYNARGFSLTLRQCYYRLVARGFIPNHQKSYKNLGEVILNARYAGLIDWQALEDRTRNLAGHSFWSDPDRLIAGIAEYYRTDPWPMQDHYFEVWVEKEALGDVVAQACRPRYVPHFSCRGYVSASEQWGAAMRFRRHVRAGKTVTVLHLGDHDPSGIDMTRDIRERLAEFGAPVDIRRIALNIDQIRQYDPPPNPAKVTDSRFDDYQRLHGDESWELDALDPQVIIDLIRDEIEPHVDEDAWNACGRADLDERAVFKAIGDSWSELKTWLDENGYVEDARRALGADEEEADDA